MSTTHPVITSSNGGPAAGAAATTTTPTGAMAGRAPAAEALPAVTSGVATQYWAELVPIPSGPMRLWFFVDSGWRVLTSPSAIQCDMVQRAFLGTGSTVQVWYDTGTGTVAGLVVSG